ncbi:FadR/GntR family transcriptional regulator [Streptomyces sp. NPDC029044]|uniref:FadR/GntR family transcriptional regulator n=1 Tax=Streptomyces sp. NPDC029044 TaxID=3157198 RepID=UPI0033EB5433
MPLRGAVRRNLVDEVIEQIEDLITGGEWPLEHRIPSEPELVELLGVGRNTVREAVRALVHSGMLQARQGDGTYVRSRSGVGAALARVARHHREILDVYEVRASLERDAARMAAMRGTPDDLALLRAALADRDRAQSTRPEEHEAFVEADLRFHRQVVAASHNSALIDLYAHLTDGLRETLRAVVDSPLPDAVRHQAPEHASIVAAIEAGDPEAAERAAALCLHRAVAALQNLRPDRPGARIKEIRHE